MIIWNGEEKHENWYYPIITRAKATTGRKYISSLQHTYGIRKDMDILALKVKNSPPTRTKRTVELAKEIKVYE